MPCSSADEAWYIENVVAANDDNRRFDQMAEESSQLDRLCPVTSSEKAMGTDAHITIPIQHPEDRTMNAMTTRMTAVQLAARGELLNVMLPALESVELEPEPNSVDETGFSIIVRGSVMRVSFHDLGHYLDPVEQPSKEMAL